MCACNGTGVIQNGTGMGMYQFGPCVCEAANQTPEEVDRKRHIVIARLNVGVGLQTQAGWHHLIDSFFSTFSPHLRLYSVRGVYSIL